MRYFRCECGKTTAWSSVRFRSCRVCDACGSTLADAPDNYKDPTAHEWRVQYDPGMNKSASKICIKCGETRPINENQ